MSKTGTALPPLVEINMPFHQHQCSEVKELQNELRRGEMSIWRDIGMVHGKAIRFSMNIIQSIGAEVRNEVPILTNAAQEAFLENACCNEDIQSPFHYFSSKNPQVATDNSTARKMMDVIYNVARLQRAPILFNPEDVVSYSLLYQRLFRGDDIQAFIFYCKYNTNLPINERLRAVCLARPESFDPDAGIESKIRMLRNDGHNYGVESLDQLMDVINSENIIHIDREEWKEANVAAFIDIIDDVLRRKSAAHMSELLGLLETLASKFSLSIRDPTKEMVSTRNHLITQTRSLTKEIEAFLKANAGLSSRKLKPILESIGLWKKINSPNHIIL